MAQCLFIVQGEGKGHMSQSLALREYLEGAGHTLKAVFVGCGSHHPVPGYFRDAFGEKLECFSSPILLRTPNRKGIYLGLTLLLNLFMGIGYMREVARIRKQVLRIRPDIVFNFYDVVGALALRRPIPGVARIGIGHHFYLHFEGYRCRRKKILHRWFLRLHTRIILRSCDRVFALSLIECPGNSRIRVVPPLVRKQFREASYSPGERYLAYLMSEGFVTDLISIARKNPDFRVDLFSELPCGTVVPPGIILHPLDERTFLEKMGKCKGLITTAGFDTLAEAAYLGVPLGVVPSHNHFEQLCNSADLERSGLGIAMDHVTEAALARMAPADTSLFRNWVDRAGEMIIHELTI